ncbi:Dethiobiotin synthetase [hydrothermal vent metagenome]|uniref:Dethiobiotin synthetase n=1 Tax=hydrothermal vent metagenome TaxID=652676 RepID=A0A3B1DTQ0_9ZZZZ
MNKKQIYFITATNTNIGKTYASEIFLNKFSKDGFKVGCFKPIETGVNKIPQDGNKILQLTQKLNNDFKVTIDDVVPYQFELPASPYVADKQNDIDISIIKEKCIYLLQFCDVLIIEGAGGLLVPIKKNYFMIDLIKEFDCITILISSSSLGSINDTLLSQMALHKHQITYKWYINLYKDKEDFYITTLPFYKEYFSNINFLQGV